MGGQISTPGGSMYHSSKWGVEGFFECVIGEVAPARRRHHDRRAGNVRTEFGSAMSIADPIAAYAETPVGQMRQFIESAGNLTGAAPGDPQKIAAAIIDSAEAEPAPRRLTLGSDAFDAVHVALHPGWLAELEAGRTVSLFLDPLRLIRQVGSRRRRPSLLIRALGAGRASEARLAPPPR